MAVEGEPSSPGGAEGAVGAAGSAAAVARADEGGGARQHPACHRRDADAGDGRGTAGRRRGTDGAH